MATKGGAKAERKHTKMYRGKYPDDFARLAGLVPKSDGKADTVAGEIARAASTILTNGAMSHVSNAVNFLALAGVFDGNDGTLEKIQPYLRAKRTGCAYDADEVQGALGRAVDLAVEFVLAYPDLEYTENAMDMAKLSDECPIDFVERTIAMHTLAGMHAVVGANAEQGHTPPTPTSKDPIHDVSTPRIANKISFDDVVDI